MSTKPVTIDEARAALGVVVDERGAARADSVAALSRRAMSRWGAAYPEELRGYLHQTLDGLGLLSEASRETVREVLKCLLELREVEQVRVDGRERLLRPLPRVVTCGPVGFLVGDVEALPVSVSTGQGSGLHGQVTRWVELEDGELPDALSELGFTPWTLEDWLGPHPMAEHLERRGRARTAPPPDLWKRLEELFPGSSSPVSDSGSIRVVGGAPGGWWGSSDDDQPGARWRSPSDAGDGLHLGARGSYGEGFTGPVLAQVRQGVATRALDLYDWGEWGWALLSKGQVSGANEVMVWQDGALQQTCALPRRLRVLLQVTASRPDDKGWSWTPHEGVEEALTGALEGWGGLQVR